MSVTIKKSIEGGDFSDVTLANIRKRQCDFDRMPLDVRLLVHEYGWGPITALWDAGVTKAGPMRNIIETIMNGQYETRERRRSWQAQPPAVERVQQALDDIGVRESPGAIAKALRRRGGIVLPMQPTPAMVNASVAALKDVRFLNIRLETFEKHRIRLKAAMAAGVVEEMGEAGEIG